eukprot:scaffold70683_cov60-Cyclotella_meneghiniana.AAC.3
MDLHFKSKTGRQHYHPSSTTKTSRRNSSPLPKKRTKQATKGASELRSCRCVVGLRRRSFDLSVVRLFGCSVARSLGRRRRSSSSGRSFGRSVVNVWSVERTK